MLQTLRLLTQAEATSLILVGELTVLRPQIDGNVPDWFIPIGIPSFSLSLAENTTFTQAGLLVFKIAKTSLATRMQDMLSGMSRRDFFGMQRKGGILEMVTKSRTNYLGSASTVADNLYRLHLSAPFLSAGISHKGYCYFP